MEWVRRGHSVVLDATFGHPAEREAMRRSAARSGARLRILTCQADDDAIARRLAARAGDPFTISDARLDIWPALRAAYAPPPVGPYSGISVTFMQPVADASRQGGVTAKEAL